MQLTPSSVTSGVPCLAVASVAASQVSVPVQTSLSSHRLSVARFATPVIGSHVSYRAAHQVRHRSACRAWQSVASRSGPSRRCRHTGCPSHVSTPVIGYTCPRSRPGHRSGYRSGTCRIEVSPRTDVVVAHRLSSPVQRITRCHRAPTRSIGHQRRAGLAVERSASQVSMPVQTSSVVAEAIGRDVRDPGNRIAACPPCTATVVRSPVA